MISLLIKTDLVLKGINQSCSRSPPRKHGDSDRDRQMRGREEAIFERQILVRERQLKMRMEARQREQAKEELYDQMVNPHLYGGPGGGYRKLRKGEHYEDVQKERLENEIRIRERRERTERRQKQERYQRDQAFHERGQRQERYHGSYHERGQQVTQKRYHERGQRYQDHDQRYQDRDQRYQDHDQRYQDHDQRYQGRDQRRTIAYNPHYRDVDHRDERYNRH